MGASSVHCFDYPELASLERRFSDWLQREGRQSVVDGITGGQERYEQLRQDIAEFRIAIGRDARELDFRRHQKYLQLADANAALGVAPPEHADWGRRPADSDVQSYDQERLWQQLEQAERQEPAGSTSMWSPQLLSDFDPNMWLTAGAASPSSVRGGRQTPTPVLGLLLSCHPHRASCVTMRTLCHCSAPPDRRSLPAPQGHLRCHRISAISSEKTGSTAPNQSPTS